MADIRINIPEERLREYLRQLALLRPIDDDFMRCLFQDNIPLVQMVLRIILDKPDLVITKCQTQKDMKRLVGGRSLCLDAYGEDSQGRKYDIEIQRSDKGTSPRRARYHSSALDVESLGKGQDFAQLPETYVIFITEKDFFGMGKPVYTIERMNLDTGKPFEDGEHILYVNGEYRGADDLGKLMHDFFCTSAADMKIPLMAERTRYLKEHEEGVGQMCKVMEDLAKQSEMRGEKREKRKFARFLLKQGICTLDEIVTETGLSLGEIKRLQKELPAL